VPTLLNRLPYFHRQTTLLVRGREEFVKPTQIIVWVSLAEVDPDVFDPATPRLPAILDTGLTHNFAIAHDHLIRWAGIDPRRLGHLRDIRIKGDVVPLHEAEIWLHPNRAGDRDALANRPPFRLQLKDGIAIYPKAMSAAPRLPLIGLRALEWTKLHLAIDCGRRRVWIRTRRRLWFLGR
jgi:hypothetical protein